MTDPGGTVASAGPSWAAAPAGPADRRGRLLDAADRVIRRDGPDASMNAIAAEAGITKPILYRHFGDKGGLYRALAERHTAELLAALRAALLRSGGRRVRTMATIDTYLSYIEAQPQVYRFLMHPVEEPGARREVAAFQQRLARELAEGIAFELGLTDPGLATAWAYGIVGMVQSAGDWWLEQRPMARPQLVAALTELVWGAFARHPARPRRATR